MLLEVRGVSKHFAGTTALADVSLDVNQGESVGLVGESGSGKSTLIRCVVRLASPDQGQILYGGTDIGTLHGAALLGYRRNVQLVFQDPYSSLNPRMTVEQLVGEGLVVHGLERDRAKRRDRIAGMLAMVGLDATDMGRTPRAFSGGQRQRIAIARALAIRPRLLVCDEPVSALDVSVQAQVINLLQTMQHELGLTILFVAHDLAVVRHLCHRVHVIHRGRIVESGDRAQIFERPSAEYTRVLLAAAPIPDPAAARARRAENRRQRLETIP